MVTLYTEQENGNLKFVAEVDELDDPVEAVEAFLEENRSRADEFVAVVGTTENGTVATVRQTEVVSTGWGVSSNGNGDEEDEAPAPKRRGRPPGTKNKSTGAKRGPGRPKGSTNKKAAAKPTGSGRRGRQATLTDEMLEEAAERINDGETVSAVAEDMGVSSSGYLAKRIRETLGEDAIQVRRGRRPAEDSEPAEKPKRRGRPPGSKNKTGTAKRGPGRPKGSTNKPKAAAPAKRGPGRPKGSKNKARGGKSSPFKSRPDED